jgi:hypothetical protein
LSPLLLVLHTTTCFASNRPGKVRDPIFRYRLIEESQPDIGTISKYWEQISGKYSDIRAD